MGDLYEWQYKELVGLLDDLGIMDNDWDEWADQIQKLVAEHKEQVDNYRED